jgi:hypothetical protein
MLHKYHIFMRNWWLLKAFLADNMGSMTNVRSHTFRSMCAILIATTISVQAGRRETSRRLVMVQGTRVHLRASIPMRLDHGNVTRHLKRGELFTVDRVDYGIAPTGHGMDGIWVHAASVRDPNVSGWIAARYVAEVATEVTAESAESIKAALDQTAMKLPEKRSDPQIIIIPPPSNDQIALVNNILGILNSLLAMFMTLVPLLGAQWVVSRFTLAQRHVRPTTVPVECALGSNQHPPRQPNNLYGSGWWSSINRSSH